MVTRLGRFYAKQGHGKTATLASAACDRALARWRFLGGGARAPGLPGTLPERLHLPLRPPAVEVAAAIPVKLQQFLSSVGVPGRR
jgi:hypothetical protein